jgi:hypothetical protein
MVHTILNREVCQVTKERSVLASFHSQSEAESAQAKAEKLGVSDTQVAHFSAYGTPDRQDPIHTISGEIPSLAALTLDTHATSRDAGILLAVDPSASGMSDGEGRITGRDWLLTVVCPEDKVEAVVKIIKDGNGYT